MPLVDSRLGPGTLKFNATTDVSFQTANARLTPDVSEEDGTPTLAEPEPPPQATVSWALAGTVIQDFTAGAEGFVNWAADHSLEEVPFEFVPQSGTPELKYTGTVLVYPVEIGGDAGVQITTDFEFPIVGDITRADPSGLTTTVARSRRRAPEREEAPA